ncbi:MAG: RNA polymerase sigma factor [Polyangiales bacterium]
MSYEVASVIREHAPFVWRALRHLGAPDAQLDDLCQDVFVVIFRKLPAFEGRSSLRTWIFGICRNVAKSAARQRGRLREALGEPVPETAVPELQTGAIARQQVRAQLDQALRALPEPMRMVFVLFEIECMPSNEVAEALGCPPSTVYSRLYAARARVYAALERTGAIERGQTIAEVI